jgi:hypothetical protein
VSETPKERRRRIGLEGAIKRRFKSSYRIQVNLTGGHVAGGQWAAASLPFQCSTAEEAWGYLAKVDVFKRFPEARSISVEHCGYV